MDRVFTELSDRENEIAQLYGGGLEVKEVANLLFVPLPLLEITCRAYMKSYR